MPNRLTINGTRFLEDLDALREFGKQGIGVIRPAFSEPDIASRRWLAEKFKAGGLTPRWDPAANLFGLPPKPEQSILIGSHSDTQPEGGWLDGAYGVILALEVARTSQESGGPPVAVVSFQDEESAFMPLTGSRYFSGHLDLNALYDLTNTAGQRYGMRRLHCQRSRRLNHWKPIISAIFLRPISNRDPYWILPTRPSV